MKFQQKGAIDPSTFTKTCEECGQEFQIKDGFSLACMWLVTGHPLVGCFPCEQTESNPNVDNPTGPQRTGQHWGCSPEHALAVTIDCLQNSMHGQIIAKHDAANAPKAEEITDEHTTNEV